MDDSRAGISLAAILGREVESWESGRQLRTDELLCSGISIVRGNRAASIGVAE